MERLSSKYLGKCDLEEQTFIKLLLPDREVDHVAIMAVIVTK